MDTFPITQDGHNTMIEELKKLKNIERPNIIKAISDAREHGDLKENAEYHAAKEKQSFIEGRIIDLEDKIARSTIVDPKIINDTKIRFGATVTIIDEDTDETKRYQIISEYEADISQGKISLISPIAKQLLGKEEGDTIEVKVPQGDKYYLIEKIEYI